MSLIAIHFARLGPYHVARLMSAVEVFGKMGWRVVALETAGGDATYAWEKTASDCGDFERRTVFPDRVYEKIPSAELRSGMHGALEELKPDAVAVAGWGTVDARACLDWCCRTGTMSIVMSETRATDGRRVWWKEWIKSRIVRKFDGALCGGESHKRYLVGLGMPEERIEFGYNVVDNEFFGGNAKWEMRNGECEKLGAARLERGALATRHLLLATAPKAHPQPYFLASNRFVERKNLARLIRAYAKYVENFEGGDFSVHESGGGVWPLVLLGDGELRGELEGLCGSLGLRTIGGATESAAHRTSGLQDDGRLGGEEILTTKITNTHERGGAEPCLDKPSGAAFSNPFTSELARDSENTSLIRSADDPALTATGSTLDSAAQGAVIFAGFRQIEELPAFYSGAGAFVHPALEEPWGLVINEAMASGLPVLSSWNVGAAEELVLEGKTGWLFDPESVEEMAAAMVKVAGMPEGARLAMGRAAVEMVERRVPVKAFGEGLAKLIGKSEIGSWR